ncbi:hypothetical protein GALL_486150 [mine drainage metagenome]|uniref:Uncharacterized protein n=1 Tax=mine drainage metagenome TaxID=410659 RepID=A0A1J5PPU1_9ZZZZ
MAENAWTNAALRRATTRSHASASDAPAPAAMPLTAANVGTGIDRSRRISGL